MEDFSLHACSCDNRAGTFRGYGRAGFWSIPRSCDLDTDCCMFPSRYHDFVHARTMNRKWFFITIGVSLVLWTTALSALVSKHLEPDGGAPVHEVDKLKKRSWIPHNSANLAKYGTAIACDVFSGLQV